ncbi:MAG: hypothetical protein R3C49_03315 [Planctomycetaceae bacterium]
MTELGVFSLHNPEWEVPSPQHYRNVIHECLYRTNGRSVQRERLYWNIAKEVGTGVSQGAIDTELSYLEDTGLIRTGREIGLTAKGVEDFENSRQPASGSMERLKEHLAAASQLVQILKLVLVVISILLGLCCSQPAATEVSTPTDDPLVEVDAATMSKSKSK